MSFIHLCREGRLEEAKALWIAQKDGPSPTDIHADSDAAFRGACGFGHLETAKWLWALSLELDSPIDIHTESDFAFRLASQRGHLETAKWLISLGGMPVSATHPLRSFYLDRFAIIGLLKVFIGRYVRNLRERLYAPGGVGYLRAKERNPLFI